MAGLSKEIDPARIGLSKSLMSTPCERKGWYSEHVRDAAGSRLRFAMPEKVLFGAAVDSAHLEIVWAAAHGKAPDLSFAVEKGMERARLMNASEPIDWDVFDLQLGNAVVLFVRDEENGLARIPLDGIRFQGANGASLKADDVIGTPDYLLGDGSVLDVKTAARRKSVADFWRKAEMPIYAYLAASEEGVLPPKLIYQVYVRAVRPYWQWLEVPGVASLVSLGKMHAAHWRAVLTHPVEATAFDAAYCGDCGFRDPMPDVGHEGCAIGLSIPVAEEVAA